MLLNTPREILDNILSHIIIIPSHPENGVFKDDAIVELFPRELVHVNKYLRQAVTDYVSKSVLWMEVTSRDKSAMTALQRFNLQVPFFPIEYEHLLPKSLKKVTLEVGKPGHQIRNTRSVKVENATVLFPFNYQSYSQLSLLLMTCNVSIQHLTIRTSQLSAPLEKVFLQQILPTTKLLRHRINIEIRSTGDKKESLPRHAVDKLEGVGQIIIEMMETIQSLDEHGHKLEATLLCMYYGHYVRVWGEIDPIVNGSLIEWGEPGGALDQDDWKTNPENLQRVKLLRCVNYIEYRACLGYVEGVNTYGYEFTKIQHQSHANLALGNWANFRWIEANYILWYGLPDHELAQMHHAKALVFYTFWQFYDCFEDDDTTADLDLDLEEDLAVDALTWAFYAWSLDMDNPRYRKFLLRVYEHLHREEIEDVHDQVAENTYDMYNNYGHINFGGHPEILEDWTLHGSELEYLDSAKEIAKLVKVQYDDRKADELPQGYTNRSDVIQRELFFASAREACYNQGIDFEEYGMLNTDIVEDKSWDGDYWERFTDIAPWEDATQRGAKMLSRIRKEAKRRRRLACGPARNHRQGLWKASVDKDLSSSP